MLDIAIVLGILLLALVTLAKEWFSVDVVALSVVSLLVLTKILTPSQAFESFGNPILVMIGSLFVLGGALHETGALRALVRRLSWMGNLSMHLVQPLILTATGTLSAFMNNTAVTAMLLQPTSMLAQKWKVAPSRILMPIAFVSICGGSCTLIGTSTNLAVSGFMEQVGMAPIRMFETTALGVVLLAIAIIYLSLFSSRLLPDNKEEEIQDYALREYLSEVVVLPNSRFIGERIFDFDLSRMGFRILRVIRNKERMIPHVHTKIESGDILLVEGDVQSLMDVKNDSGLDIRADVKLGRKDLMGSDNLRLVEGVITPNSPLVGKTLKSANFRQTYDGVVLAMNRLGQSLHWKINEITLREGDTLLIQCDRACIQEMMRTSGLAILGERDVEHSSKPKALMAGGLFFFAVFLTAFGWIPVEVGFLCGALIAIMTRCISIEKAREYIDWRLLILIGGISALGVAMDQSGAAALLADVIAKYLSPFGLSAVLAGFMILSVLLTQPLSNAAAALVVLPVALHTAELLNANPRAFAIGVMISCSMSLITPFEPSCILVYGPGKYRFFDYVRLGGPLTLILLIMMIVLIPVFWPLQ